MVALAWFVLAGPCGIEWRSCCAQEELIERPGPPPVDNLEIDENKDGLPDGWYNARDAKWMAEGGRPMPARISFVSSALSRAGRHGSAAPSASTAARPRPSSLASGFVRTTSRWASARVTSPALMIDFLGEELHHLSRGVLGPWTHSVRDRWTRVAKRIPVPPGTKDAIMSVGLMGATGTLDFDGLTVDLVPVGGRRQRESRC